MSRSHYTTYVIPERQTILSFCHLVTLSSFSRSTINSVHKSCITMQVIGMISGTSVDGIDVAVTEIQGNPLKATLAIEQLAFMTVPWHQTIRQSIFTSFDRALSAATFCRINFTLAEAFANAVRHGLNAVNIPLSNIDLIGSHGQTIMYRAARERAISRFLDRLPPAMTIQSFSDYYTILCSE